MDEIRSFSDPRFERAMLTLEAAGYGDVAQQCRRNHHLLGALEPILDQVRAMFAEE